MRNYTMWFLIIYLIVLFLTISGCVNTEQPTLATSSHTLSLNTVSPSVSPSTNQPTKYKTFEEYKNEQGDLYLEVQEGFPVKIDIEMYGEIDFYSVQLWDFPRCYLDFLFVNDKNEIIYELDRLDDHYGTDEVTAIKAVDVNGDGKKDIVIIYFTTGGNGHQFSECITYIQKETGFINYESIDREITSEIRKGEGIPSDINEAIELLKKQKFK